MKPLYRVMKWDFFYFSALFSGYFLGITPDW